MIDQLINLDTELFYSINGTHSPFFDAVFWALSQGWFFAIVLSIIFFGISIKQEKKHVWIIVVCIALSFFLADRISVMCFKDVFCRLRPCHALENVRLMNGHCGGMYGFVSSHAANSFSLATFFAFAYRRIKFFPIIIFVWAALVAYSRPYLGVHYPGDIICGAMLGLGTGTIVYLVYATIKKQLLRKQLQS